MNTDAGTPAAARSQRPVWRIIGWLVLVVMVPSGVFLLVDLSARRVERSSFVEQAVRVIDVRTSGKVEIVAADRSDVAVDVRIQRGLRRPTASHRMAGDTLQLRGACPAIGGSFCSVSYTVRVPASVAVRIRSSGGSVSVTGTSGAIEASSSGGGVRLTRTTGRAEVSSSGGGITLDAVAGRVDASSSGGGIGGTALRTAIVAVDSSGGGVRLTFATAPTTVDATSSGGGVRVELPAGEALYAVDASSSGGGTSVGVRTDPTSARRIHVRSSGGGVSVVYSTTR